MTKSIEHSFRDWESNIFGFGYGTGEEHTLPALKAFFELCGRGPNSGRNYDFAKLESALGATVAWLLINTLCHANIIEYGTSPRYGWLTPEGEAIKAFMAKKSIDELVELCSSRSEDETVCYPDACNCGPNGYQKGVKCPNPFWAGHHGAARVGT